MTSPQNKIKGTNSKLGLILNPTTGKPMSNGIVFHHIDDGHNFPSPDKIDIFFTGIKTGHVPKLGNRNQGGGR